MPNTINVQGPWVLELGWLSSETRLTLRELRLTGNQFVVASNQHLPFADGSIHTVITNNVPIDGTTWLGPGIQTSEIWRILTPGAQWINNGVVRSKR